MNGGSLVFDSSVGGAFTVGGLAANSSGPGYDIALQDNAGNPVALTVGGNNSSTYAGVLSGSGSLTMAGNGTLILSGSNGYSGGTTINGGILGINADAALGNSAGGVTFSGNGTLQAAADGIVLGTPAS